MTSCHEAVMHKSWSNATLASHVLKNEMVGGQLLEVDFKNTGVAMNSISGDGNWKMVETNWKQFKGSVKAQWSKLTDDQIDLIAGKRELLSGKIQLAYGFTQEEADVHIRGFVDRNTAHLPRSFY